MIPVNEPLLDGNEKRYLCECIDSGWISSEGPYVSRFESEFSKRVGRREGIAVCNGTAAIDAIIESLRFGPGDEIILPAFTIISCINQIIRAGATPVLVDSDPLTWNMDVSLIEERITQQTRAIMVVHTYGLPVDMDPVIDIANRHGLLIIEDAAEAHGQTYRDRPCGSFGVLSAFSFYPNKHVTTGEGGMIVTDDEKLGNDCRSLRNLCFQPSNRFVHDRLGWNMRMTNLQAALGMAQLERLDEFTARKRHMGMRYNTMLGGLSGVQLPCPATEYADNIYWVYGLLLNADRGDTATEIMNHLAKEGIGTRPFFFPMHLQPVFRKTGMFAGETYPVAEHLYRHGFYIPSGMGLTETQMNFVAEALHRILS